MMKTLGIVLAITMVIAMLAAPMLQDGAAWREAAHKTVSQQPPAEWGTEEQPEQAVPAVPVVTAVSEVTASAAVWSVGLAGYVLDFLSRALTPVMQPLQDFPVYALTP